MLPAGKVGITGTTVKFFAVSMPAGRVELPT